MRRRGLLLGLVPFLVLLHFFLHLGLSLGREAPDLLTLALLLAARETRMGTAAALGFFFGIGLSPASPFRARRPLGAEV